ncbi:MAG TPA: hypothetical protein VLF89_01870 [Candidatus Saccharimonadales bacterium]|nr:hypothetical protein [Candidatus Saccharimonadales bacterium]
MWINIKKAIGTYGPYVLKFIIDQFIGLLIFIKNQIAYAIKQILKG